MKTNPCEEYKHFLDIDDKTYEECRGCLLNEMHPEPKQCFVQKSDQHQNCPCNICLVKSMCINLCEEYSDYGRDYP